MHEPWTKGSMDMIGYVLYCLEALVHAAHVYSESRFVFLCLPRQPYVCKNRVFVCICLESSVSSNNCVVWHFFTNKDMFSKSSYFEYTGPGLFGRLGPQGGNTKDISGRVTTPWYIAAQIHVLGHYDLRSPGIDWVLSGHEQTEICWPNAEKKP